MLRSPLWEITKWMLDVVDMVFDTLMTIATFDILNNNFIMNWYFVLCGLIGFFVLIRLLVVMTKSYFNEEYASKTSIINTLMKIALITLIISLVPVAIGYIASITNSFLDSLGVLNGDDQFRMSDAIVKSMGIEEGVDWRTIKINERSGWFGAYKYDFNFFWTLIVCGSSTIGILLIALQIGQRMIGIGYKFLISPWAIASLVTPDSNTFQQWATLITLDYVSNAGQVLLLYFVIRLVSEPYLLSLGIGVSALMLIAGILSILSAPAGVAQLFGNDFGSASALQGLQTMSYAGAMAKGGVALAAAGAMKTGGGVVDTLAMGVYGAGRMRMNRGLNSPEPVPQANPIKSPDTPNVPNGSRPYVSEDVNDNLSATLKGDSPIQPKARSTAGASTVKDDLHQGILRATGIKAYDASIARIKQNVKAADNASRLYHFIQNNKKIKKSSDTTS